MLMRICEYACVYVNVSKNPSYIDCLFSQIFDNLCKLEVYVTVHKKIFLIYKIWEKAIAHNV